jgi:hypothetical protein
MTALGPGYGCFQVPGHACQGGSLYGREITEKMDLCCCKSQWREQANGGGLARRCFGRVRSAELPLPFLIVALLLERIKSSLIIALLFKDAIVCDRGRLLGENLVDGGADFAHFTEDGGPDA